MKKKQGTRGAISVFLSIILVPCILISCLFVDASRVSLSRASAESSADLALNTLLTNYDADLKDWYGMVASCQSISDFYDISAKYFLRTLASQGMSDDEIVLLSDYYANATRDDTIYDLLKVEAVENVSVGAVEGANLSKSAIVKDQVVDFMKYRAPIEITKNIIERIKNTPGLDGVLEADENKPMTEAKEDYYEAHGELVEKAVSSYWAIDAYFEATKADKFSNQTLQDMYGKMPGYKDIYEKIMPIAVINLTNTGGLQHFERYVCSLDAYGDKYTNPDKFFRDVYSEKEKDPDKEKAGEADPYVYKITASKIKTLVDDLAARRDEFRGAITDFGNAAQHLTERLPDANDPNGINPIQWWVKADAAVSNYKNAIPRTGRAMIEAYAKVQAIDECELDGAVPSGWTGLDQWKTQYNVGALNSDVRDLQSKYLTSGGLKTGETDLYLKAACTLQNVSNTRKIDPVYLYIHMTGGDLKILEALSNISKQIHADQKQLDKYIKLLNKAIDGDASDKTPSMNELRATVVKYQERLKNWGTKTAQNSGTAMKADMEKEIAELEKLDITPERVDELKLRLVNIRSQLQAGVDAMDTLQLAGGPIKDIVDAYDYVEYAGAQPESVEMTNSALNDYAKRLFAEKFRPDPLPEMQHADEAGYNVTIDPATGEVETPELYRNMHREFKILKKADNRQKFEKAKGQKDDAKKNADEMEKNAKKKGYTGGGKDIKRVYSPEGRAGNIDDLLKTVKQLAGGNFSSLRDGLYTTVYAMEMFSCATHENEGRYNLLADKDKEKVKDLDLSNYQETYKSFNGDADTRKTWRSASLLDTYNKSLTNKMICKANNRAFAGEIEYILYGGTNKNNIEKAYGEIYVFRYGLNLVSGFQNFWFPSEGNFTGQMIQNAAGLIMSMTSGLIPEVVTKAVLIPILTIFETCNDLNRLEAGFPVEVYKVKFQDWWYALGGKPENNIDISQFMSKLSSGDILAGKKNNGQGLFYSDYMTIMLACSFMSGQDTVYGRLADLIQANMRQVTGSGEYTLTNSNVYFNLSTDLRVKPLMTAIPLFVNNVENDTLTASTDWCTYKINVTRGY